MILLKLLRRPKLFYFVLVSHVCVYWYEYVCECVLIYVALATFCGEGDVVGSYPYLGLYL